jgi:GT2 family glycosyltransferase
VCPGGIECTSYSKLADFARGEVKLLAPSRITLPVSRNQLIDVIVPVQGPPEVFARCAESLARHVDPSRHTVTVVLDGPQPDDVHTAIDRLRAAGQAVRVERHGRIHGFVISCNRGMRASDRDVVLLNSDTRVTAGWLDRLANAAYSDPKIATVTPFSNNASICSVPITLAENTVPAGYDVDSFAALVGDVSRAEYPRIPTGVGMCLYIKRQVINEIGLFDEAFGPGYGEEVDFCQRASARGYVHVLDDATYIFHEGSRSFGVRSGPRIWRAEQRLRLRYPRYRALIADFLRRDPLAAARARVRAAIRTRTGVPPGQPRILHLVDGWPPFADHQAALDARTLALHQAQSREVMVYARTTDSDRALGSVVEHDDNGIRVRLVVNNHTPHNPLSRAAVHSRRLVTDFTRFVDEVRPASIHVHDLSAHCASLLAVVRRRGIPIVSHVAHGEEAASGHGSGGVRHALRRLLARAGT